MATEEKKNHIPPEEPGEPFFPDHVIVQLVQALIVIGVLVTLAAISPAPMEPKADQFTTPLHIKPEWYFLAAYQFLKIAEKLDFLGAWAPKVLGIFGQGVIVGLLFMIPFLDRNKERNPLKRPIATTMGILGILGFIALTIWGKLS